MATRPANRGHLSRPVQGPPGDGVGHPRPDKTCPRSPPWLATTHPGGWPHPGEGPAPAGLTRCGHLSRPVQGPPRDGAGLPGQDKTCRWSPPTGWLQSTRVANPIPRRAPHRPGWPDVAGVWKRQASEHGAMSEDLSRVGDTFSASSKRLPLHPS